MAVSFKIRRPSSSDQTATGVAVPLSSLTAATLAVACCFFLLSLFVAFKGGLQLLRLASVTTKMKPISYGNLRLAKNASD